MGLVRWGVTRWLLGALACVAACDRGLECAGEVTFDGKTEAASSYITQQELAEGLDEGRARSGVMIETCGRICWAQVDTTKSGWQKADDACRERCMAEAETDIACGPASRLFPPGDIRGL